MEKINRLKKCILILLIVFSLIYSIQNIFAITYNPTWHDYLQNYRISFNITGATTNLDNATLKLNINQSFMGPNFNFSADRNSIRMYYYNTTSTTYTLANHYALSWDTINNNASIQFKAPYLKSGTNNEYFIYFGDSSKSNTENLCSTYIYCDNFSGSTINSKLNTADNDAVAGTAFSQGSGVLTITAGGTDTWTSSDKFGSVYLNNIPGNVDVKVAVTSQTNTNSWTKTGIMIRNDMTQPSVSTGYVFDAVTPSNGYAFQTDSNNNGYLDSDSHAGSRVLPSFLRLVKVGNSFSGYYSKISLNSWNLLATKTVTSTNNIQDIGLSLTSHAGSTLATAKFDNLTVQRYTTDTFSYSNSNHEELLNYLTVNITNPSLLTTQNIKQNTTLIINGTIKCNSYTSKSCSNVTSQLQYNNSVSSFTNILTTSTTPMFSISSNPISCILDANQSCNVSWKINFTGIKNSLNKIRILSSSNDSNIQNITSSNLRTQIIIGNSVSFNQSIYDFKNITEHLGSKISSFKVISDNGNNTNIKVSCESGDCSKFTQNWNNGINLNEDQSKDFNITCLDNSTGNFSAIYNLTSNEFSGKSTLKVSCNVEPLYGPLFIKQILPITNFSKIRQNGTFKLKTNISCLGVCGKVTAFAKYIRTDWWNNSFLYKQQINISSSVNTQNNYQVFLQLNSSNLGSNFNWANNCNDLRFVNQNNPLNYWVSNCNTTGHKIDVWVKTNNNITTSTGYNFYLYYGNNFATSQSNATNTFISDKIFLVAGRCPSGSSACDHTGNHSDFDIIRANIGLGGYTVDGQGYVSKINNPTNPYSSNQDNYFTRYRFLFIPKTTSSYSFGTASDDASDAGIFPNDGFGGGIRTSHPYGPHDIVTYWYGGHGTGTCGADGGTVLSKTLSANSGYWLDYIQEENTGGQDSQMCMKKDSSFYNVNFTNFPGEIFSREYSTPEPIVSNIGNQEGMEISTNSGTTPFWTTSSQPQTCNLPDSGSCNLEWNLNATGAINSSWLLDVYAYSNYSNIATNSSSFLNVTITNFVPPTINITYPLNNSKILSNRTIPLKWYVNSDLSTNLTCKLFINDIYNQTVNCPTNTENILNKTINFGVYNWTIQVNDSNGNYVNSTNNFIALKNYNLQLSKKISYINSNIFRIELSLINNLNNLENSTLLDFVQSNFNYGSFSKLYNWTNIISGIYSGKILGWNLNTNSNITYSITKNTNDYNLKKEFIIGLD